MALVTFIEPRSHPLTPELNFLDLAEGGENLREMLLVDVPCQSPDVNLAWWRRRRFLPPTRPAPGSLGAGPLSHFLLLSRGLLALLPLLLLGLPPCLLLPAAAPAPAGVRAGLAAALRAGVGAGAGAGTGVPPEGSKL